MSFRLYDPHERHRRSLMQKALRTGLMVVSGVVVLMIAYNFGRTMGNAEFAALEKEVVELREHKSQTEKKMVSLQADAITAQTRLADVQQQYKSDIGDENLRALNRLLRERLSSGVKPERLQQVIAATTNVRNCSAPESKRFIVATPLSKGPESKVTFGSGLVAISGAGATAVNDKGGKESWFDPAKPVKLNIAVRDGQTTQKEGVLPLQHSVIQGGTEYRFTINTSNRSYAEVVADQCAYP